MEWLVASLVLSVILTVLLNVLVRAFPGASDRAARRLDDLATPKKDERSRNRVRVYAPWKAMLITSLLLTIALNVLLRLL